MRKYIVKGNDLNVLLTKVAKHFEVDVTKVKYEILRKTPELEVKVWTEHEDDVQSKENFNIEFRDEGIFLEVKKVNEVKSTTLKEILKEIEEKKIKDVDIEAVESALYKLNTAVRISDYDKTYYIDALPIIEVLNSMEATIKITKPKRGRNITPEAILSLCQEKGIVFGIRKKAINTIIQEQIYDQKVILAKGKEVVHGKDATINYSFQIEKKPSANSKENEAKNVDFKELGWLSNIAAEEILASKVPPVPGVEGVDIYGKIIAAKEPKDITLVAGKNTYVTDDGMYLKSKIDGQIIQKGKSISVEPILTINGNVDYSTGNIDFLGSVIIKGNVAAGFSVKSAKDILVEGLVEDSELVAQGQIIVNNGILGNEEFVHTIFAKECIKAQFIQHMKIKTDGFVEVPKHILHSYVEAGDKIICTAGTGKIIGGEIKSQNGIECNIAGGPFETPTKLILDVYSDLVKEESEFNKEMLILEENKFKIEKLLKDIEPIKDQLSDELKEKTEEALKQLAAINNRYVVLQSKKSDIDEQRQLVKSNQVRILQRVFPGVVIKIGREIHLNRAEKIRTDFFIDKDTNELTER